MIDMETRTDGGGRLFKLALGSLLLLVLGTFLYPDTYINASTHVGPFRVSSTALLFIITFPAVALYVWRNREKLKLRALDYMLVATMVYVTVRGLLATSEANMWGLVIAFSVYTLLIYYGTAVIAQKKMVIPLIFTVLAGVTVVIAVYGMVEFFLDWNILYEDLVRESVSGISEYNRVGSTLAHPVAYGIFLVMTAPYLVFFFAISTQKRRKLLLGSAIVLVASALYVTFTKGSWITAVVLFVIIFIYVLLKLPRERLKVVLLVLAVATAVVTITAVYPDTVRHSVTSEERVFQSYNSRLYLWGLAAKSIKRNPVFGVGLYGSPAEVVKLSKESRENEDDWYQKEPLAVGNLYLTIIMENGVVGLILAAATSILLIREGMLVLKKKELRYWTIPILFSMSVIFIQGVTSGTIMVWAAMVIFWLGAGMLRALADGEEFQNCGAAPDG